MTTPTPDSAPEDASPNANSAENSRSRSPQPDARGPGELEPADSFDDELPEREPLTPELVEDEAIRGDFVMRWAVVLLALLVGFTTIVEARTLVHIKAGQYMAAHGFLPPKTDVFSYTASERPWVNLSWLFDLGVAGLYSLGSSAWALTVFKAVIVGFMFWLLVRISRPGVSTWWGSILAALAVIATYDHFRALPELMTLWGLLATLWLLVQWEESGSSRIWGLPAMFLLWSNVDPRMFLGLALVVLYAAGSLVGAVVRRGGEGGRQKQLWAVVAVCVLAAMINPYGWRAIAAPWGMYGVEQPAAAVVGDLSRLPMTDARFWDRLDHRVFSGLLLLAAAGVSLFLNRKRANFAHVFVIAGFAGIAIAGGHELAAAAVVCAGLATLNFQEWYRVTFRQTYSTDTQELLFSRGGRVVTVLALFGLAYLAVSGRLGAGTIGVGLDESLQSNIEGIRADLKDSFDDKPFNFNVTQGDLLIWADQKVFVDSRLPLYAGTGDQDLLDLHNRTRYALRKDRGKQPLNDKPEVWKATLDRYGVTHVLPRLGGPEPADYLTQFDLQESKDWQLTRLGSVTASYYRRDMADPKLQEYLKSHDSDFRRLAFQEEAEALDSRADWAHPESRYQRILTPPDRTAPTAIQQAAHYSMQLQRALEGRTVGGPNGDAATANAGGEGRPNKVVAVPTDLALALANLSIRKANEGLAKDPQCAAGYSVLGVAYEALNYLERQIASASGGRSLSSRRYFQALNAYSQSLVIEPNNDIVRYKLTQLYSNNQKYDLALQEVQEYTKQTRGGASDEEIRALQQNQTYEDRLKLQVAQIRQTIDQQLAQNVPRYQVAVRTYQQGFVLHALRVLREDPLLMANQLPPQQLQALLLMEAGRVQESFDGYGRLEGVAEQYGLTGWRSPAALAALANGRYERAIELWTKEAEESRMRAMTTVLQTLPLAGPAGNWPLHHTDVTADGLVTAPFQVADALLNVALCHLETGETKDAEAVLRRILEVAPSTSYRPLVRYYLAQFTGEFIDPLPPSQWIPVTPDMFAAEADGAVNTPPAADGGAAPTEKAFGDAQTKGEKAGADASVTP